ncbi:DUF3999 domain-containing protein [Chitinilyticum litopenaei]|uniref:DUF3999 domain-containing protein n=1 Tax=Chitinilyticum litopenaei TaxID=1121276 RepID=UPI0003F65A74|nr:DUF3999 domain-containing protein [Chitinilyticum litopenaei]
MHECVLARGQQLLACGAVLLVLAASAQSSSQDRETPAHYAVRQPIVLHGQAPAYRFDVPASVYAASRHDGLRDLRVFNADGEPVPVAYSPLYARPAVREHRQSLAFFAVPALATEQVSQDADGRLQLQRTVPDTPVGLLLDASQLPEGDWQALRLQLAEATYRGRVHWLLSDDLQNWRTGGQQELLKLAGGPGQTSIDLAGQRARYLRLDWLDKPLQLHGAELVWHERAAAAAVLRWSAWQRATPGEHAGEYLFDLGLRAPVERLEIRLPQANTVVNARWQGRAMAQQPWQPVAQGRLSQLGVASVALEDVGGAPWRYWRLLVDTRQGGLGQGMPELRAAWPAGQLTFIARGKPPFVLAYGREHAGAAPLTLDELLDGQQIAIASATLAAPMLTANRPSAASAEADNARWRKAGLWASLVLAVLLLAVMAWKLLREPAAGNDGADQA